METTLVISGTVTSELPITPEQLAKMETLSSHLGLASILTFSENMNRTVDINARYACSESIQTEWFAEFVRKLATVFYLGEKFDLRLAGSIEASDVFYEHLEGEINVENGSTTFQDGRMEDGVFQLAGLRKIIDPLPHPGLA